MIGTSRSARTISLAPPSSTTHCSPRSAANDVWKPIGSSRGRPARQPGIGIIKPYDGKAATPGNGAMVAIAVDSQAKVKALYDKAMKLGAKDEGAPGLRWGTFYAAYFRDLDGNKLNFFHFPG